MKKYINPEMKELAFVAEETIADLNGNLMGSNLYNDTDFGGLVGGGEQGQQLN